MLLAMGLAVNAANEKTNVAQVSSAVSLTTDVDYIITGNTPFTTDGVVDIVNTEHAVVIIKNVRPSEVQKTWLKHITINGEAAKAGDLTSANKTDGSNCLVKMYNRGTIIMPYGQNFQPLTCYTEKNFEGESCKNYSEGSNGGYMKDLSAATLNNNFKSFKLKRGYMVTFALGKSGWGYSRCFIADKEDLEMNLPDNMIGRVSSYRLFKWWDASKAGIHDTSSACNTALKTTSCFDWAQGNASLLPDAEWVPNHIYEDWPSSATCGSVTGSCHMKTNNEPGNSADDHPQDVETVLNNWQNLMRTGMRLCSESSHDGSMNHLKTFIEEIDKRGWRCDILDLHCYWTGQFNNLDWYRSEYGKGRPIWISEWVYGSSWGNAGIFNNPPEGRDSYSTKNQQKNYEYVKPILDLLNSKGYIERYFYWNSEADCSKIYKNGVVSKLGQYYAEMETGLAYNKANEYVPKVVYVAPANLEGVYNKTKRTMTLTWNDANGDMLDSVVVEIKPQGASKFTALEKIELQDMNAAKGASYTYTDTPEAGATYYRIAAYPIGSKTAKYSNEASVTVSSSMGTDLYQYGKLTLTNLNAVTTDFTTTFETEPTVFMGICSNKNGKLYPGNLLTGVSKSKFVYQVMPWEKQSDGTSAIASAEEIPYLAIQNEANLKFGDLSCETGTAKVKQTVAEVKFRTPFPEGVTPVVITEIRNQMPKNHAISTRIWDVTNEGFKAYLQYEEGLGLKVNVDQTLCYMAITPGIATMDKENGLIIAAGHGDICYGTTYRTQNFTNNGEALLFSEPYIFGGLQTYNYQSSTILRRMSDIADAEQKDLISGTRIKRMIDATSSTTAKNTAEFGDEFGWIVLSRYKEGATLPSAIGSLEADSKDVKVKVVGRTIKVDAPANYAVYNASGAKVNPASPLAPGVYVVKAGSSTMKVIVK